MFTPLTIRRLSAGSVYKLIFIGLMTSMLPLGLIMGVMAWIGFDTVSWEGMPVSGPAGVVVGLMAGLWVALSFTAMMGTFTVLGLWLYARWRPLHLEISPQD